MTWPVASDEHGTRGPDQGPYRVYRQGRVATLERWFRWLDEHGGVDPMTAVAAAVTAAQTGRSAEAERWADAVDRWQRDNPAPSGDPAADAWAAVLRALMCRRGVEQMRADADEAARRLTTADIVAPAAPALQGLARLLTGDLDGADLFFEEGAGFAEVGAIDTRTALLCERCLVAMARDQWDEAGKFAAEARAILLRAEAEDPLVSAVAARVAMHQGDVVTARRELVAAQRLRPVLTYATPHLAVQARIELVRVHLARLTGSPDPWDGTRTWVR